jgi:hypothetical protein
LTLERIIGTGLAKTPIVRIFIKYIAPPVAPPSGGGNNGGGNGIPTPNPRPTGTAIQ